MPGGMVVTSGPAIGAGARKSSFVGISMVAFAAFGGILFGYDTGTISGIIAMKNWLDTFGHSVPADAKHPFGLGISTSKESLIVSILSAGTFIGMYSQSSTLSNTPCLFLIRIILGALTGGPVSDTLGRRGGIISACIVFSLGVALQTGAHNLAMFIVGRFFAGLGVGLISTAVPIYQSECAPKWIRGAVVGGYQWAITIGILLANVINNATKDRDDHSAWQIPIGVQLVWAAILFTGMFWLPEVRRSLASFKHS